MGEGRLICSRTSEESVGLAAVFMEDQIIPACCAEALAKKANPATPATVKHPDV
jgi:hypothetical protein